MPMVPARSFASGRSIFGEPGVDLRVHPAHEERGHGGHPVDRLALRDAGFQRRQVCFGHLAVVLDREEQGDVDVDAVGEAALDRRPALLGAGNLDHDIGPVHRPPEPHRFGDGGLGVARGPGRDFERDEPVGAVGAVVDRAEQVGGALHVLDRESPRRSRRRSGSSRPAWRGRRHSRCSCRWPARKWWDSTSCPAARRRSARPAPRSGASPGAGSRAKRSAPARGAPASGSRSWSRLPSSVPLHFPRSRSTRATTASAVRPSSR